ncbi:hypothetical protein Pan181_34170 [Aeoliella mucimassa]|uniref:Uncharacterized protein n=1 Tax=Aeoliella mucimassa TaxID=2527972 RepID=A0A518AR53_9BACT|nr:hypothetical protein Pan181_34170 [Aeoliella mucimassa]
MGWPNLTAQKGVYGTYLCRKPPKAFHESLGMLRAYRQQGDADDGE